MRQQYRIIRGRIASLVCSGVCLVTLAYHVISRESTQPRGAFGSEIDIDQSHRSLLEGWFDDPKTVTPRLALVVSDQQHDTSSVVSDANIIPETVAPPLPLPLADQQDDSRFVVQEANLFDSKHAEPAVILSRPTDVLHLSWGDSCHSNTEGNCNGQCDCRWSWPSNTLWESPDSKCRCKKTLDMHNGMTVDVLSIGSKTRLNYVSTLDSLLRFQTLINFSHATRYLLLFSSRHKWRLGHCISAFATFGALLNNKITM